LSQLEECLDLSLHFTSTVVTADLWDAERLPACEHCRSERVERLRRLNVTGCAEPRIGCTVCGAA